jgi:hypothetical protein
VPPDSKQSARLDTEYIMTLYATMDPPQRIDDTLSIFAVMGGLAAGPQIKASIIQPAAYWTQRMPGGSSRIHCD